MSGPPLLSRLIRSLPLFLVAFGVGCSAAGGDEEVRLATTVYPLEFVAREVAGNEAEIVNVTPPGAEPHDVELSSEQVIDVIEADVVAYIGEDFQPPVEEALADAQGESIDPLEHVGSLLEDDGGAVDPHFWLDPMRLSRFGSALADVLAEVQPERAAEFEEAAADLEERLEALDGASARTLDDCRSHRFVTSHAAFGYLADRYGLEQIGLSGIDPESEPSPQRIAEVVERVLDEDITTIFFERLLAPDAAEAIARETGAETAVLDPLESAPEEGDYITAMEANVGALAEALGC